MNAQREYDAKEEGPRRTEIDPFRTVEALRIGEELCFRAGYEPEKIRLTDMIWAVLVEAAKTERALEAPRGKGYGVGWPDVVQDHFAAARSRLESGLPEWEPLSRRPMPTAAQISRHEEVMIWLRFCHADDKLRARDVLWGRACGRRYQDLRDETGLTVQRLRSIKSEQLRVISERIKAELKKHNRETSVFA